MLYSTRKKIEHAYKTLRYGKEEEISSVSPNAYATRFYDFISAGIVCYSSSVLFSFFVSYLVVLFSF